MRELLNLGYRARLCLKNKQTKRTNIHNNGNRPTVVTILLENSRKGCLILKVVKASQLPRTERENKASSHLDPTAQHHILQTRKVSLVPLSQSQMGDRDVRANYIKEQTLKKSTALGQSLAREGQWEGGGVVTKQPRPGMSDLLPDYGRAR